MSMVPNSSSYIYIYIFVSHDMNTPLPMIPKHISTHTHIHSQHSSSKDLPVILIILLGTSNLSSEMKALSNKPIVILPTKKEDVKKGKNLRGLKYTKQIL